MATEFFREILKSQLEERVRLNAAYSLRAFARDLRVSPASLSAVLVGRQNLSPLKAQSIAQRLPLTLVEREQFIASATALGSRSPAVRTLAKKTLDQSLPAKKNRILQEDVFRLISDWHHLTLVKILELNPTATIPELALQLETDVLTVRQALARLLRLKIIKRQAKAYQVLDKGLYFSSKVPSSAIRKYHQQMILRALAALVQQPIDERYFETHVFTIALKDMSKAAERIRKFIQDFVQEFGASPYADQVYALSTQLFKNVTPVRGPTEDV